jgi:hypothetical protein
LRNEPTGRDRVRNGVSQVSAYLVDRLQIDEGKVGRLSSAASERCSAPTILLCGFLTDAVGRKGVWLAPFAAVAVSILMPARTHADLPWRARLPWSCWESDGRRR